MSDPPPPPPLHLFEAVGVELEYMIVDAESLDVSPIAAAILRDETGAIVSDVEHGDIAWSNELVSHVIELKTNGPAASLDGLAAAFQSQVAEVNRRLAPHGARLLPTAMHPWMDPHAEMVLWPHEYGAVYEAFNRVFDCRGHGWANLQSMHVNLPFSGDEEFGRLHAAVRLLLPLLPALAASSPLMDGRCSGFLDSRLEVYRTNSRRIPSVAGRVVPEPAFDEASYDRLILRPMFADIAPHDPTGILQNEFLNARGAIARFSRGTIEIRVIDMQECPAADLAIAAAAIGVLKLLVSQCWTDLAAQQSVPIDPLETLLLTAIRDGERTVVDAPELLPHFGVRDASLTLGELWRHLLSAMEGGEQMDVPLLPADRTSIPAPIGTACPPEAVPSADEGGSSGGQAVARKPGSTFASPLPLDVILERGPLARRITDELPASPSQVELRQLYQRLAECLASGTMF